MEKNEKLGQLTSLRFVAAAMVVFCHMAAFRAFGIPEIPRIESLGTGVTFFFVLSGFILAHVYPALETPGATLRYLRARVARIWPGHAVAFLLACWLQRLPWDTRTAVPNLMLLDTWNPFNRGDFGYNSVSWSLSTEFFFYLAFPFLIRNWAGKWPLRMLVSAAIVIACISYSNYVGGPRHLFVSPVSRIFEFMFGMLLQLAWVRNRDKIDPGFLLATIVEIAAIACCVLSVCLIPSAREWLGSTWVGPGFAKWLYHSGSMFTFGAAIFVMALGRGGISRFLAHPWCVLLGEISFSIYLLHWIFLSYYAANFILFPQVSNLIGFSLFWIFLLVSSYVMWSWVEMPARHAITRWRPGRKHGGEPPGLRLHPVAAGIVLALMVLAIRNEMGSNRFQDVRILLASGYDPNAPRFSENPPLFDAAWSGRTEVVETLLRAGANPNAFTKTGATPLIAAATTGYLEPARLLLQHGAQVDLAGHDGATPLMVAAWKGNRPLVELLLAGGANARTKRADGLDAIELAQAAKRPEIVALLTGPSSGN